MNWKVLAGVLLVLYVTVTSTKEIRDTATNIQNGLSKANELGKLINAKQFTNVMGKLVTDVTPYLGIVGPFVSLIMGFVGHSVSAELQALKRLFTEVDNRFDKVNSQFAEVKRVIDWRQINYSDVEQQINTVNREFEHISTSSTGSVKNAASNFVKSYESNYKNSGITLYDSIMNGGRVFGDNLFTAAVQYTKTDRAKCQSFMLGILQLLMKAAKLELAYYQLKGQPAVLHDYQNQWINRFTHIRIKMLSVDNSIVG